MTAASSPRCPDDNTLGQLVAGELPERERGDIERHCGATPRSDQFALCVCLWEALVGTRPFRGGTVAALVGAMRERPKLPIRRRTLLAVLARGLDPEPAKRWSDVAALDRALDRARRWQVWRAVLAAAAVVALAALAVARLTSGP